MTRSSGEKLRYWIILLLFLLIVCAALWAARESGQQADLRMRRTLVRQAKSIVETILPEDVCTLSFTAEDSGQPEFQRLGSQLKTYAEAAGLRSIYTMALRDGKLVFGPGSLSQDDPYASPPGTVYQTPTKKDFEIFQTGEATIQGPSADKSVNFVTASVPVIDPHTDQVLLVLGLDQEASVWRAEIRKAQWIPFLTAMSPLSLLIAGYFILKIRNSLAHTHYARLRHTEAVTCATTMLLLTLISARLIHDAEKKSREDSFYTLAKTQTSTYIDTVKALRSSLRMLASFFNSSEHVTRDDFRSYCEPLLENNPIQACIWLPEVLAGDAEHFTGRIRTEDFPKFSIWQLDEQEQPVPAQGTRLYPTLYIEPLSTHKTIPGYNLYSEPACHAAIDDALRADQSTATDPINLLSHPGEPSTLLIFKPVRSKQMPGLAGFSIRPDMLLASQLHNPAGETQGLSITLYQLHKGQTPDWLSCSMKGCQADRWETLRAGMHATIPIFAFGKTYGLLIAPEPQWMASHPLRQGRAALSIGLILTLLMTTLIATLANRPALLEKRVQQRTTELQENQARLRALVETIPDLIWLKNVSGVYLSCNTAFERLFGAKEAEIVGKTDYDFVGKEQADFFRTNDLNAIRQDRPSRNEESLTFATDGYYGCFETVKTPVKDAEGNLIGVLGVSRDITIRKKTDEQIQSQLKELNRWYQVTLGRETRVLELKTEINGILQRNGEPPRYKMTADDLKNNS